MDTKKKILDVALKLFSEKGYSAVYLNDIAKEVNIKAPSLYKHYKSKQDIFNSCVFAFKERINNMKSDSKIPSSAISYENANEDDLVKIANHLFTFYLKDEVASRFRKMLLIERYHNQELNAIYEDIFINKAVIFEEEIFAKLIEKKVLKHDNPHVLALEFYSPIFYLLQKYDMHQDKIDDAMNELSLLIHDFCKNYS